DYSQWGAYSVYDEDKIQELVSVDQPHYESIAIHYFTQYHLHLQLLDAVQYAHKKEVIIKGDLPIGVGRHSVDTWMYPHLFHMDMQAGAPPDAFATKGQNWSFPTYNWEIMRHDDFAWWRQRMEHMSNYFDAIRIDHVLGFFRIWSIPMHAVEGIFGRFIPTIPLRSDDFNRAGVYFDEFRLCEPYVHDEVIRQLFGDQASWAWENLIEGNRIRPAFRTQRLALEYFDAHPDQAFLKPAVFDLLSNVILLRDEDRPGAYHFRIGMTGSTSFGYLSDHDKRVLERMYHLYFFEWQNGLWHEEVQSKLDAIQKGSTMLICAEDLGMVPAMVEDVLKDREMLSLQVQRMPKASTQQFAHPSDAPYLSVVTPSTHDMSTVREWWEEDHAVTQQFYNQQLGHYGGAPFYAEPWICREIINQHLHAPAMWAVFLLQDLMAMDAGIRRESPLEERINVPANPDHYWNYRMHLQLEELLDATTFCQELKQLIAQSGR
ncbi:MAG TPA: 4-alpha-glucanotransferase, partial [Ferruginibacter sp.]|nr:4-alpha-glucanotransferase [Ferruginibacter sp.]